ncbi:helix-turn-helix transcriptional regulator [Streptomyces longisporoflavus]|uniref:helix-turn-helix domain-containing protein n=1 Tax=Streptomyces longisporoflavus TaxID=28044 RepID=UPI0019C75587|nr:helix-turn-helix transcriptional regulator [Streptomyces longisporoflavus]GGV71264.1 helix-turn-helix transcriptional regulator [Streptomyces longisporoflavus]
MTNGVMTNGVVAAAERAADAYELFGRASAGLRRQLPFDAAVWTAADPETGLITAPMRVENLGTGEGCAEYWQSELLEENVLPFRELARAPVPAAGLRAATGDLPARSSRFRRLLLGQGVHDELRAVLRIGDRPWGLVSLFRTAEAFRPNEVTLLAGLSRPLAERLRTFARPREVEPRAGRPGPGLVLFDASGEATSVNDEARHLLSLLPQGPSFPTPLGLRLPIWVIGTALQARAVAGGRDHGAARVRIRTAEGRWLTCHASCLTAAGGRPGPVALVIEPAGPADLGVLVADAYGLTSRELQITQLVARGTTTGEIASTLFISPHTVRDHLKAVFTKAGVTTRGELTARLFTEHYWPVAEAGRRPTA